MYIIVDKRDAPPMYRGFTGWTENRDRAYPFNLRVAASEHRIELAANGDSHAKHAEIETL